MKKFFLLAALCAIPSAGFCLSYQAGASGSAATVSSQTITTLNVSTLTVINNATIGATDSGGDLTIGGGTGDTLPRLILDKDGAGAGQVIFNDAGSQRGQVTLDSSEQMVVGTDSNQALLLRTNSTTRAILDISGQLNLGTTLTNGSAFVNISSHNAMVGIFGSTNTGTTTCGLGNIAPVTSTFPFTWGKWNLCGSDGTGCQTVYVPFFK